ncbi:AAA family ATPase [Actinoallomurus purpureus]|uniref:phosphatase domain-containing protein n=1 Tax=Actinoallomurus purpureus TaxID=478114 RepID=UPI002092FE2A|nr:AAA family ATPase [Actinoallomurus purpureus]MCO6011524.1 AAA family ATPase [Actinoallomurus purpureus]
MGTLHITRGLPGSGKTTWAHQWTAQNTDRRVRVNRDDLRGMLDDSRWIKGVTEGRMLAARDAAVLALLRLGLDVACDDTNLPNHAVRALAKLARQAGAELEVHDFTDVPLETCIARDAARDRTVGEAVIRDMHARFLNGRPRPLPLPADLTPIVAGPRPYEPKPGTRRAALVDIDGTVALMGARSPYDETSVSDDQPNRPVIEVARALRGDGCRIVFLSGRTETCREATTAWLHRHVGGQFDGPFMRKAGDTRRDSIVKAELFDRHVRDTYDVRCVLDDRNQVVEMWRSLGLTVLQVAEGDF